MVTIPGSRLVKINGIDSPFLLAELRVSFPVLNTDFKLQEFIKHANNLGFTYMEPVSVVNNSLKISDQSYNNTSHILISQEKVSIEKNLEYQFTNFTDNNSYLGGIYGRV